MADPGLTDLVQHARSHSPFYPGLHADVPLSGPADLAQLPILDHAPFRAAFSAGADRVLTDPMSDGIVFRLAEHAAFVGSRRPTCT